MASHQNGAIPPGQDLVDGVMKSCSCSEENAINLLNRCNNDPEEARIRHKVFMKYFQPSQFDSESESTDEDAIPTPPTRGNSGQSALVSKPLGNSQGLEGTGHENLKGPTTEIKTAWKPESTLNQKRTSAAASDSSPGNLVSDSIPTPSSDKDLVPDISAPGDSSVEGVEQPSLQSEEKLEWDFILPIIQPPATLLPGTGASKESLDLHDLVGALQHGADLQIIQNYLSYWDKESVKRRINDMVEGFPTIFYAVATNNPWLIRTWIEYGGDPGAVHEETGTPLIAFAIMHSETLRTDTVLAVATLLSLGASPEVVPAAFYKPYWRDLPEYKLTDEALQGMTDLQKQWCTSLAVAKLSRTINLTQRYHLERASKTKKPSTRHRQIAKRRNAEALLGIPYLLIGQTAAANRLLQKLLSHLMLPGRRPLVLVFAGPSGHGKTELARQLGNLLSLPLAVVDCTIFHDERELFGPRHPYVGAEQGSPLNNFLVSWAGQRSIVFLDEFEKTSRDIHQSLLLPFDNGEYQDRRDSSKIDCSKTIWILATNAVDQQILDFCDVNRNLIFNDEEESKKVALMKQLSKNIKEEFLSRFQAPITGRVSAFLPFLTFSPGEQAVVVHKFLLELGQKGRTPINLSNGPSEQLLGNVHLRVRRDAAVCGKIAEAEYHPELGARSLINGVKNIEDMMVEAYLDIDEKIAETDGLVDFVLDISGGEIMTNMISQTPSIGKGVMVNA